MTRLRAGEPSSDHQRGATMMPAEVPPPHDRSPISRGYTPDFNLNVSDGMRDPAEEDIRRELPGDSGSQMLRDLMDHPSQSPRLADAIKLLGDEVRMLRRELEEVRSLVATGAVREDGSHEVRTPQGLSETARLTTFHRGAMYMLHRLVRLGFLPPDVATNPFLSFSP